MSTSNTVSTNNTSLRSSSVTIPDHLKCPMTLDLLNDPVICEDGNTYERNWIEEWFRLHDTSPMTNVRLRSKILIPNRRIKDAVDAWGAGTRSIQQAVVHAQPQPVAQPLRIQVDHEMIRVDRKIYVLLTVIPSVLIARLPIRFIFLVDISGSMGTTVDSEGKERTGYTRLDLVKYTISVIMSVLGDDDYVSIIPFSNTAMVLVPLTRTNSSGKALIKSRLESMMPTNSTNIYDALRLGMETSRSPICNGYTTVNLLLTDGVPNINPPQGLFPTVERDMKKGFNGIFSTFAFGYDLDSHLLKSISDMLEGSFVFIPDATLLATGVINNVASSLSIVKDKFRFNIDSNHEITNMVGGKVIAKNGSKTTISTSMVQSGQPQTILIEMLETLEPFTFQYSYDDTTVVVDSFSNESTNMKVEFAICHTMSKLDTLLGSNEFNQRTIIDANTSIREIVAYLQHVERDTNDDRIKTLLREFVSPQSSEGQVAKAFESLEYYEKWGKHYVRSFTIAHKKKQCNNYKDVSVQAYGGDLFRQIRESTDELFNTLPPPTPSERIQPSSYGARAAAPVAAPTNMSQFNNPYDDSDCFGPMTVIQLENGATTTISKLTPGDILANGSKVKCIVEYPVNNPYKLVWFKKEHLEVTPWHPVFYKGKWIFPHYLVNGDDIVLTEGIISKYNFVLDSIHIIPFDTVGVCTLAHGFTDNIVIKHDFYGTGRVLESLEHIPGYSQGRVVVDSNVERIRNQAGQIDDYIYRK